MDTEMRIGFIGAGKVGCSLGKLFSDGGYKVSGYYSRTYESACEAASFTGSTAFRTLQEVLVASDALFLTVPDDALRQTYRQLCAYELRGKQLCHCSGSLSAHEVFDDTRDRGASCYSIHPLFPVSSKFACYTELAHAYFCVEGDDEQLEEWQRRIEALGPTVQPIAAAAKKRYHAACCISSNLVCALAHQSIRILVDCGFDEDGALHAITPLMRANMEHIIQVGPQEALTGPVERNDVATVASHLACLASDGERDLYRCASLELVDLAQTRHPDVDYSHMHRLLEGNAS